MIRVNYHLTEGQLKRLKALSERTGLSVAELIRRAVDGMLRREGKRAKGGGRDGD
jgi:predicted DNA-binding protein